MPSSYLQGIQRTFENELQIRNDIHAVSTALFVNRCPLVSRTPRAAVGSTVFTMIKRSFRSREVVLGAALLPSDEILDLEDVGALMNGDVLELPSGEHVEVIETPDISESRIRVRRGVEGTTPAAAAAAQKLYLISNSRDGGEVDQAAIAIRPVGVTQYCQTWQHPVQISGSLQASTGYAVAPGVRTPFDQNKMDALQNLMDDMEVACYYSRGESPEVSGRPKQKGLKSLLTTNKVLAPQNASAYKSTDFMRDTLERCRTNGGDPDVLLLSSNFMTGLVTWGQGVQRLTAGSNVFGTPIEVFEAPFLGGVTIIEAPLLKPYTAICLTSSEVRLRMKRNEFWNPRGSRGDAVEGDWIAEGAIEVENEQHHAWLEGITAFSAG
jgi:hypothetical protein